MAEYSRDDSEYASNVVNRLFARETEGLELPPDVVVSDVETDARTFSNELSLLKEFDANVPAVMVGDEAVPVSLTVVFGRVGLLFPFGPAFDQRPWRRRRHPWWYEVFYDYIRPALQEQRKIDGMITIPRDQARQTFISRATDFVATRFASVRDFRSENTRHTWHRPSFLTMRQWHNGPQVITPGCHFTVSTNSNGLRVFWSGAYYVTPNNFNHPTSPTSSVLQAGTYTFGVDGGAYGNVINWDYNAVVSLPGQPYVHLNY